MEESDRESGGGREDRVGKQRGEGEGRRGRRRERGGRREERGAVEKHQLATRISFSHDNVFLKYQLAFFKNKKKF